MLFLQTRYAVFPELMFEQRLLALAKAGYEDLNDYDELFS